MKKLFIICVVALCALPARADEGMWLLPYLNKLNIKDMKREGLKLSAKDIYNVNGNALKDAIVIFGGGCTGEVVSPEGLLLTNHHCGYDAIQQLSTVESDFLKNGFWAMNRGEEIPAPGLSVTFIRRLEDVTGDVLGEAEFMGVGEMRDSIVKANQAKVLEVYKEKYPEYTVSVRMFMGGNQYFAIMSEVYNDVRLVGTPPNSMGKFGGDTDNWMWPRQTDDFSMFRIYAGPDNRPAEYSAENRPYQAPVHLKISLKGYKEKDFAMILGFPGSTQRYMTTYEMQYLIDTDNANRIFIRGERQKILMEDMLADDAVRLQYASKYASSSNYWKNSIGMNKALIDNNIPARKAALEEKFTQWAAGTDTPFRYAEALPNIKEAVEGRAVAAGKNQFLTEAFLRGIEVLSMPAIIDYFMETDEEGNITNMDALNELVESFYKDFNEPTDRRVAKRMLGIVRENFAPEDLPSIYGKIDTLYGGDIDLYVEDLYRLSNFSSKEGAEQLLANFDKDKLQADPAFEFYNSVLAERMALSMEIAPYQKQLNDWRGIYMKGLAEMNPGAKYYPDANFTMRLTYGQVLPYEPRDGVVYKYYTTLKGVVEKEDPSNPLEFTVPQELKAAYEASDYGQYGQDGQLRLNFLTNNDITGGNSGSPVLNGRGELIGLAFDGNWEAMSGDIVFEPELQRCINLDIRYLLWTIDKFAGAGYILNEMTIVK